MTAEARSVVVRLSLETAQAIAASKEFGREMGRALDTAEQGARRSSRGLDDLGRTAGRVGLIAAAGLGAAVLATARFDKSMSQVQAATHETAGNMAELRQAALDAGRDTAFSASGAAGAIEELAKAGVSTRDVLAGGLSGALNLAAAGQLDVGEAAETAASAMTQFGLSGDAVNHIADLLAAGAGKAQGSVHDLGMALNQSGLVASQVGLSLEETTGTLAAFASAGLTGSDAGTSFKTMLLALTPQSDKASKAMQAIGFSAYDASGNFVGMAEVAQRLRDGLADMSTEQQNATLKTIFGNDAIRAANVLYAEGANGINDWTSKVDDAGYAAKTAAINMDNLSGDVEQLKGSLETLFIGAGEGAQGPLRTLVQSATQVTNALSTIPKPIQNVTSGLLAITAIGGGATYFGVKIVEGLGHIQDGLAAVGIEAVTTRQKLALVATGGTAAALGASAFLDVISQMDSLSRSRDAADATVDSFQDLADALQQSNLGKYAGDLGIDMGRLTQDLYDNGQSGEYASKVIQQLTDDSHGFGALLNAEASHILPFWSGAAEKSYDARKDLLAIIESTTTSADVNSSAINKNARMLDGYTNSTRSTADAQAALTSAVEDNVAAMKAQHDQFLAAYDAETQWGQAIADARKSIADGNAGLSQYTKEGRANREVIAGLASAWNEQSNAVKNNQDRYDRARGTFVDLAQEMGLGKKAAQDLADKMLDIPRKTVADLVVEDQKALAAIRGVKSELASIDPFVESVIRIRTEHMDVRLERGHATGGLIVGEGTGTSDSVPIRASNGEYVVRAAAVAQYGVSTLDAINAQRFAGGGLVGRSVAGGGGNSTGSNASTDFDLVLADLLDVFDGGGKKIRAALDDFTPNLSQGVDGVTAEVEELRTAIRQAGHKWTDAMRAQADALIEEARQHDIGKALKQFGVDVEDGADGVRDEVRDLRAAIREAGGEWTKGLQTQSQKLFETANAYDLAATALSDSQGVLNDLLSKQSAYADQVGHLFNDSPFGNGLRAFDRTVGANTSKSGAFQDALGQLAGQGLDGPLFEQLAASGDLKTAIQLLATGSAGIEQREQMFAGMLAAQTSLGAFAGDQVFGADVAAQQKVVADNTTALANLDARLERQEAKFDRMVAAVEDLPKHVGDKTYAGTRQGAEDGIKGVTGSAGNRMSMERGPRP